MKKAFRMLSATLAALWMLTSCLNSGDDDNTTYYDDVAITSFSLGTLNRYLHTTSSTGADSTYKATYTGSAYQLTIDQLSHEIYNRDSLPMGTDLGHVVCTITTRNNALPYFKSLNSDTLWIYNSTDSIDLSQPRLLRVFATDGTASRDYTVTLRVKQSAATGLTWVAVPTADFPSASDDGAATAAEGQGLAYVGKSSKEYFARGASGLLVSTDMGQTWTEEQLDTDAGQLPVRNIATASWPFEYADNADYTLMVGNDDAGHVKVWHKIAEYDKAGPTGQWVYMAADKYNDYTLPEGVVYSLAYFNGRALAFGSHGLIYTSLDKGITWKEDSAYTLPDGATGIVSVTTGADGNLWLYCQDTGQAWRGYYAK